MSNLRLWSPRTFVQDMIGELEKVMESPRRDFPALFKGGEPKVDISETATDVIVKADVPGFKKEELQLSVTEDSITIRGETKSEKKEEKENFYQMERYCGSFSRTMTLPSAVKNKEAKASYQDGVLTVTIPKTEQSEKSHKVDIT